MKIQVLSDLHLEFEAFTPVNHGADVLILAGDIAEGGPTTAWMHDCLEEFPFVVYVPGNHEYYRNDITLVDAKWLNFQNETTGFRYLNPGTAILENKKIIGGCWWTDYWGNDYYKRIAHNHMNDYVYINYNNIPFTTNIAERLNIIHTEFFKIHTRFTPDVVITHTGPTTASIDTSRHTYRPLDAAYVNKAEDLVFDLHPKYWIHGHTHQTIQYDVGDTTVVANAKGYRNENPKFNSGLILEV